MKNTNNTNPYFSAVKNTRSIGEIVFMHLTAIFSLLFIIGVLCWTSYKDTLYKTTAEVYSVDEDGTLFVDGAGYVWAVYDTDYTKGDFVEIKFNNNRTNYTRNDDKIINVKVLDD